MPGAYAMIAGAEDGSIHLLQAMVNCGVAEPFSGISLW